MLLEYAKYYFKVWTASAEFPPSDDMGRLERKHLQLLSLLVGDLWESVEGKKGLFILDICSQNN